MEIIITIILSGIFWVSMLTILFWITSVIISLTINTQKEYSSFSDFYGKYFNIVYMMALVLARARVKIIGKDMLPKDNKFLFVSNHRSNFDTFIHCVGMWNKRIAFISKPENFKIPMGHRYMTRCMYLSMDRDNARAAGKVIAQASDYIKAGECAVGVYPEGTRNKFGEGLLEFKPGCFKIALWAKCPIVIAVTRGSNYIHRNFPIRSTHTELEFVKVLQYDEIKDLKTNEIAEIVYNTMKDKI